MLSSGKFVCGIKGEEWVAVNGEYGEVREESNSMNVDDKRN